MSLSAGKQDATEDDVQAASEYADIHQRILTFPQQYNTIVGERGLKLSGGEKQRVCMHVLMRGGCLLHVASLILDEGFIGMDACYMYPASS